VPPTSPPATQSKDFPMQFSEEQEAAIDLASDRSKKLVGVTGEAGTGKTTILKEVERNLEGDTCLCAPTGRAAKRIQEATGVRAMTIHRMLKIGMPDEDDDPSLPAYDKFNKMPYDNILVDESSMVADDLYRMIIDAMKASACVRFFGDANQLPPVTGVSPFLALLEKWPSAILTHNYRSDDGVVSAARSIIRGRTPQANGQFQMINPGTGNLLPAADKFIDDTFRGMNSQIIIPTKKGKYGTFAVNRWVQNKLNPSGKSLRLKYKNQYDEVEEFVYRIGDKVIWTKNDYQLRLMNGEIGWVVDFDTDSGEMVINFSGKDRLIPPLLEQFDAKRGRNIFSYDPRKNLDLAYAITTHKAQGSEFKTVLLLLNRSYVLNRANFYTAVTRAKDNVTCLFGPGGLHAAMSK